MSDKELYALEGFSANGINIEPNSIVPDDKFDSQVRTILIGMGRLVWRDVAEPELPIEPEPAKGAKGLPPLK